MFYQRIRSKDKSGTGFDYITISVWLLRNGKGKLGTVSASGGILAAHDSSHPVQLASALDEGPVPRTAARGMGRLTDLMVICPVLPQQLHWR